MAPLGAFIRSTYVHRSTPGSRILTATVTSIRANAASAADPSLDPLLALVAPEIGEVNRVILDRMRSPVSLIPELAGHLIAGGGKRLRPMLTLACARLIGYGGTRHHKLAAAVEFIHTATLLHDDVVDMSGLRRGRRTANIIWGNAASVLVGDFLFSRSFELMVEDGSLKVLKILSNASAVIAEGEVDQLSAQRRIETDEDRYLAIITAKTATLFAAAAEIAGVVAEREDGATEVLEGFGRNLGIAFQLIDDVLDYDAQAETTGKAKGDDFREGKVTLPVILAYARADEADRAFLGETMAGRAVSDADLERTVTILRATRALDDTRARARLYADRAAQALARFPGGAAKVALLEATAFSAARGY